MAKLTVHIKYFLSKKISEDAAWRHVQIIFSGHEVPGEGEHKIMEYIRLVKGSGASSSHYSPNTRHCIYGLDADLIMLGLLSHEPHACLLREQITFGKPAPSSKSRSPPQAAHRKEAAAAAADPFPKFDLLHLCLFREYLDLEFKRFFTPTIGFPYSVERVIDDFILLSILIGNDFVPHLPTLHIHTNAYNIIFDAYKASLPLMKGYLNENGKIRFDRLGLFLQQLSRYELDVFLESGPQPMQQNGNRKNKKSNSHNPVAFTKSENKRHVEGEGEGDAEGDAEEEEGLDAGVSDSETSSSSSSLSVSSETLERALDLYEATLASHIEDLSLEHPSNPQWASLASDFADMKRAYYSEKLGFDPIKRPESLERLCYHYFSIYQWILFYYYQGVPSWSYFYPFHYAPKMSDLAAYLNGPHGGSALFKRIQSDLKGQATTPFHPFEQLMAVLPPGSASLVPTAYRDLMSDAASPIIDFYPSTFLKDMNGKKNDWEAIVCIPFIEESRLLETMRIQSRLLSEEERKRNEFGPSLLFRYSHDLAMAGDSHYPPPSLAFQPIHPCCCEMEIYDLPVLSPGKLFVPDLCPGARTGVDLLPGFPTLATLPFVADLERIGIRVFTNNPPSQNASMVLCLQPPPDLIYTSSDSEGNNNSMDAGDDYSNVPSSMVLDENCVASIAAKIIAQTVYVEWPFRREALVHSLSDGRDIYEALMFPCLPSDAEHAISKSSIFYHGSKGPLSLSKRTMTEDEKDAYERSISYIQDSFERKNGIRTGPIHLLVSVLLLEGLKEMSDSSLVKCYAPTKLASRVPYQLCNFATHAAVDPKWTEKQAPSLAELWPRGSTAVYVCHAAAAMGPSRLVRVSEVIESSQLVEIESVPANPALGAHGLVSLPQALQHTDYLSSGEVANALGISSLLLSKLASTYHVYHDTNDAEKINIGLEFKFEKQGLKVLGYSERHPDKGYWLYSHRAIELLREYKTRFQKLFYRLEGCLRAAQTSTLTSASKIMLSQLFDSKEEQALLQSWMASKSELKSLKRVPVSDMLLSEAKVKELQAFIDQTLQSPLPDSPVWTKLRVKSCREQILSPRRLAQSTSTATAAINSHPLHLGTRVLFGADPAHATGTVSLPPLGSIGTIVGIASEHGLADVLLDVPFSGASDLGHRCDDKRGMTVPCGILVPLLSPSPSLEPPKPAPVSTTAPTATQKTDSPNKMPLPNPWIMSAKPVYNQVPPPSSYQEVRKSAHRPPLPRSSRVSQAQAPAPAPILSSATSLFQPPPPPQTQSQSQSQSLQNVNEAGANLLDLLKKANPQAKKTTRGPMPVTKPPKANAVPSAKSSASTQAVTATVKTPMSMAELEAQILAISQPTRVASTRASSAAKAVHTMPVKPETPTKSRASPWKPLPALAQNGAAADRTASTQQSLPVTATLPSPLPNPSRSMPLTKGFVPNQALVKRAPVTATKASSQPASSARP